MKVGIVKVVGKLLSRRKIESLICCRINYNWRSWDMSLLYHVIVMNDIWSHRLPWLSLEKIAIIIYGIEIIRSLLELSIFSISSDPLHLELTLNFLKFLFKV